MANQSWSSYAVNYYGQSTGNNGSLATTNNPLLTSHLPSSVSGPSIYANTTRISNNKKQSKNGGFLDQNAIRRGFNGTAVEGYPNSNSFGGSGRNREGSRQKNNRKQISSSGGFAAQNSDEGTYEWSGSDKDRDSANYTEPKYYLGKLIQGTYCSRVFNDCEKRACRIQSPNYPGVYPRNLTCFYAIRQVSVCPPELGISAILMRLKFPRSRLFQPPNLISTIFRRENTRWSRCDNPKGI